MSARRHGALGLPLRAALAVALLAAAAISAAVSAGFAATSTKPRLPHPRPAEAAPVPPPADAEAPADAAAPAETAEAPVARLPRPRPDSLAALRPPDASPPSSVPTEPPPPPETVADIREEAACRSRLRALGVTFTAEPPLDPGGSCAVRHPLKVTAVGAGVAIAPDAILSCRTAEALAIWVRDVVVPTARHELGAKPVKINQVSSYVCRTRYGEPGAKISEHARANAIDIGDFAFDDHADIGIEPRGGAGAEGRFQAEVREGACKMFTTVLGPGSNAAHDTHFHLDTEVRKGGYRLCELAPAVAAAPEKTKRE